MLCYEHSTKWIMTVYTGHPELFVFIDETGSDRRDCMRYSLRGKPAVSDKLLWRGQRASAIYAKSMEEYSTAM